MKTLFKGKGKLVLTCLIALCAVVLACAVLLCCNLLNKENTTAKEDITTIEQIQTPDLNIKNTANIQLPDVTTSDGKAVFDIPYSANSQTVTLNQTVYSSIPGNLGYVLSRVEGPIETTGDEIWIYNGTSNKLMIAPGAPIGCYDVMFDMYDGTTEIGYSLFVIQIRDASVFSLSSATMTLSSTTYTYDGTEKKPYPTIKLNEYSSVSMGNYTVSYENNVDVGTATVTVTGSGYYTGSKSATFTISEADLSSATVELDPNFNSYAYDGAEKQPVVTVKLGKATISDANYTVSYENNIDVGTATVKIKSKGNNCIGETSITFNITLADISEAEISGVDETYTYTGAEIKPVPTVTLNDNVLAENTAYTLTYASNIELGTATITITGIGSYEGTATKTFVICQINIKDASISGLNEHYDYTGSAITPEITVTIGETVLVKDTDYTITYSSNTAKGTATITLTGTGNYEGTKTVTFIIDAKDLSTATITGVNDSYPYTGSAITPAITVTLDGLTLVKDTDYTVSYSNNTSKGTATVTVTGKGNYSGTATATFTISAASLADATVTGLNATYSYTGTTQIPTFTVSVAGKTLTKDTDYAVSATGGVDAGSEVTLTISGLGNYTGKLTKTYTITKKVLGVNWVGADSFEYTGAPQGKTAEFTGVALKDAGTVTPTMTYAGVSYAASNNMPVDVDVYTLTVTLDEKYTNYEIVGEPEINFVITKATLTVNIKFVDYDPETDDLYPDETLPKIALDGSATVGGVVVTGKLQWAKVNGKEPWLLLNTNSYTWEFIPDNAVNYEICTGEVELTAVQAELVSISVQWNGTPTVYQSTTLDKIRELVTVTGELQDGTTYPVSNYVLTGSWGTTQNPSTAGKYDLEFTYNNGVGGTTLPSAWLREVTFTAVAVSKITYKPVEGASFEYYAFDKFDKSTITVTAVYNDGTEEEINTYTVAYNAGRNCLWAGDTNVTLKYGTDEKTCQVNLTVKKVNYDLSKLTFNKVQADYDGTAKRAELATPFADGTVEYVYRLWDEKAQEYVTLAGTNGATNAGRYQVVAYFKLEGEENLSNYPHDANGVMPNTLTTEIVVNKVDYANVSRIEFVNVTVNYNNGESVIGDNMSFVKNLPVGVTPKYEYMDQYGNKLDPDRIINPGEYTVTVTFTVDGNHNPIQSKTVKLIVKDTGAAPTANNGLGGLEIALIVICLCLALLVAIIALVIAFKRRNGGDDGDGFYDNITVDDLK